MATIVNASGEVVCVSQFFAAMYWGFVLSTSLVGISLVQGYLYFMTNNKDRWSMKALVVSLLVLDPATSFLMAETIYHYFVVNFGVTQALEKIPISWVVENGLSVLVTAMVQVFFASRIYLVNQTVNVLPLGRTAPVLVFVFALLAFVMGIMRTIFIGTWSLTAFSDVLFQVVMTIEETCALVSDFLASACLCYILAPPRIDSMRRSKMLKTLCMFTINRAILMSIVQIGMLSAYLSAKTYLYWVPFHLCKSKLYTNTLLAMLNSRTGGSFRSQTTSPAPWNIPIISLIAEESGDTVELSMITSEGDVEKAVASEETVASGSGLTNSSPSGQSISDPTLSWTVPRGGAAATTEDDRTRYQYPPFNSRTQTDQRCAI